MVVCRIVGLSGGRTTTATDSRSSGSPPWQPWLRQADLLKL
jgi:hypothetical protein